jgi:hypothetical protein
MKLSSDGGDCGRRNAKEDTVSPTVVYGGVCVVVGSQESGVRFYVGSFGNNLALFTVKMSPHDFHITNIFYKHSFNVICKDNTSKAKIKAIPLLEATRGSGGIAPHF